MKRIDAIGLPCPQPVILTKQQIDAGEDQLVVLVDNETAQENITRLGEANGFLVEVEREPSAIRVQLCRTDAAKQPSPAALPGDVLLVGAQRLGTGQDALGATLMQMFFYTLEQEETPPRAIVFLNEGVYLPAEDEQVIAHLAALQQRGCEVLVCGTCLNFYGLSCRVGTVSNMYDIVTRLRTAALVISLP